MALWTQGFRPLQVSDHKLAFALCRLLALFMKPCATTQRQQELSTLHKPGGPVEKWRICFWGTTWQGVWVPLQALGALDRPMNGGTSCWSTQKHGMTLPVFLGSPGVYGRAGSTDPRGRTCTTPSSHPVFPLPSSTVGAPSPIPLDSHFQAVLQEWPGR